jgi:hypothetical protein
MYFPVLSNRFVFVPIVCIVGVIAMISLSGLHFLMLRFMCECVGWWLDVFCIFMLCLIKVFEYCI